MGINAKIKQGAVVNATGATGFTGAAPQAVNGTALSHVGISLALSSLSANVYAKATTNTLTLTGKWQVSNDGSTWNDAYPANRPANVVIVTGTGSAIVDTIVVEAPNSVYGKRYSRFVVTSGVGVGGGAGVDEAKISYNYRSE